MPLLTMMTTMAMDDAVATDNNGDAAATADNNSNGQCQCQQPQWQWTMPLPTTMAMGNATVAQQLLDHASAASLHHPIRISFLIKKQAIYYDSTLCTQQSPTKSNRTINQ
jgi:hypothetical protein